MFELWAASKVMRIGENEFQGELGELREGIRDGEYDVRKTVRTYL